MPKVFWAYLKERNGTWYEEAFDSYSELLKYNSRQKDFHRWKTRSLPVADTRNAACQGFWGVKQIDGKRDRAVAGRYPRDA